MGGDINAVCVPFSHHWGKTLLEGLYYYCCFFFFFANWGEVHSVDLEQRDEIFKVAGECFRLAFLWLKPKSSTETEIAQQAPHAASRWGSRA